MKRHCPYCLPHPIIRPAIVRKGRFWRKSDGQFIQRFRCRTCNKGFSSATEKPCYRQNKRHKNEILRRAFASGISQRRVAKILKLNRNTVVRKFIFLGFLAGKFNERFNCKLPKAKIIEFDDMETFEHTKCKPLSITLAVESGTRRILGFEVSKMPCKGRLAKRALKKYGLRKDYRFLGRRDLFRKIQPLVDENALIKSDQNPHYPMDVAKFFPMSRHETCKGQRGVSTAQGELKKIKFDPIFSLNHTCAKFRADVNRLFRKTWCTTKNADRLVAHLNIFVQYHNESLQNLGT